MLKVYKRGDSVTWPNGETYTYEMLCDSKNYAMFGAFDVYMAVDEKGITHSFGRLDDLKKSCNVDIADNEAALAACEEKLREEEENAVPYVDPVTDLQNQLDEMAAVVDELIAESLA